MIPHGYEKEYAEEIARIKGLTNEDLAKMRLHEVMEMAIPYGASGEVADTLGADDRTVQTWRVNPDLLPKTGSLKANDPSGRRGPGHRFNLLLIAVNGVFPPGAQLLLRWQALKLAKGQTILGHERMEAIMELAEEMKTFGEEVDRLQAKRHAMENKMAAIVAGWTDTT